MGVALAVVLERRAQAVPHQSGPEPRRHRVAARRRPVRRRKVPLALVLPVLRVQPVQPVQGAAALAVDAALRRLPSAWGHRSR